MYLIETLYNTYTQRADSLSLVTVHNTAVPVMKRPFVMYKEQLLQHVAHRDALYTYTQRADSLSLVTVHNTTVPAIKRPCGVWPPCGEQPL